MQILTCDHMLLYLRGLVGTKEEEAPKEAKTVEVGSTARTAWFTCVCGGFCSRVRGTERNGIAMAHVHDIVDGGAAQMPSEL